MTKNLKIGSDVAMSNGLAFGFFFIILSFFIVFMMLDLLSFAMFLGLFHVIEYTFAFILLLITFPISLWYFGRRNVNELTNGNKMLIISAKFSFGVNSIIWSAFFIPLLFLGPPELIGLHFLASFSLFTVCGILTTITLGYYIVKKTEQKLQISE